MNIANCISKVYFEWFCENISFNTHINVKINSRYKLFSSLGAKIASNFYNIQ